MPWTGSACLLQEGHPATTTFVFRNGLGGYSGTVDTHIRQSFPAVSFGLLETVAWNTDDPPGTMADTFALLRIDDIIGRGAAAGDHPLIAVANVSTDPAWCESPAVKSRCRVSSWAAPS